VLEETGLAALVNELAAALGKEPTETLGACEGVALGTARAALGLEPAGGWPGPELGIGVRPGNGPGAAEGIRLEGPVRGWKEGTPGGRPIGGNEG
jgi:hypothetical protein